MNEMVQQALRDVAGFRTGGGYDRKAAVDRMMVELAGADDYELLVIMVSMLVANVEVTQGDKERLFEALRGGGV